MSVYYQDDLITLYRANALNLPLADDSVDLVVTSPPYFGLRSYQDGGEHYEGQIGAEATPAEFVDALIAATREMVRVVKPSGSIWVNLGDKYAGSFGSSPQSGFVKDGSNKKYDGAQHTKVTRRDAIPTKSLMGIPWRYALRCIDDLGLILRAEVVWSKPNGLPESVTDRVRRSHEQWFHFTLNPRYYSAVDEVREAHAHGGHGSTKAERLAAGQQVRGLMNNGAMGSDNRMEGNPLGKLPGSVWTIPTEPLRVPDHLGIDHFAAFPTEWPRRIITGWSPRGVCVECGEGRRPVRDGAYHFAEPGHEVDRAALASAKAAGLTAEFVASRYGTKVKAGANHSDGQANVHPQVKRLALDFGISQLAARNAISNAKRGLGGESCDCPEPTAPTTPGVVLDPFSGTGTTALVASVLGRHGIGVDMSADYCRLAAWRTTDPKQRARAARKPWTPPAEQLPGQEALDFGGVQ